MLYGYNAIYVSFIQCMENAMTFKSFLSTSAVLLLTLSVGCTGERKDGFGIFTMAVTEIQTRRYGYL